MAGVCVCVCIYIYTPMYIYIYTHTHTPYIYIYKTGWYGVPSVAALMCKSTYARKKEEGS